MAKPGNISEQANGVEAPLLSESFSSTEGSSLSFPTDSSQTFPRPNNFRRAFVRPLISNDYTGKPTLRYVRRHSLSLTDDRYARPEIAEEEEVFQSSTSRQSCATSCVSCSTPLSPTSPQDCILPITEVQNPKHRRQRLVSKDGVVNVQIGDESKSTVFSRDMFDLYTTLLELKWGHLLLLVCLSLILSWGFFGLLWYAIVAIRGDLGYRVRTPEPVVTIIDNVTNETVTEAPEEYVPCIEKVDSWITAFLYSLEAQTTIGFGARYPTDRCVESVFLLVLQTVLGVCQMGTIGALMAGKFIRPNRRKHALKLSKYAVVESNALSLGAQLVIRMYDLRSKSRIVVQQVSGVLVRNTINPKTGSPSLKSSEVKFKPNYGMAAGNILLTVFPVTFVHEIDATSPFLGMERADLAKGSSAFELLVAVDGMMECNGLAFRKLSSYLPDEIKLGYCFEEINGTLVNNRFCVDFQKLELIQPIQTRLAKARSLQALRSQKNSK